MNATRSCFRFRLPSRAVIRKILVPVDYSECSTFACRYAIKIACKVGAEIKFFHTYYSPAFDLIELAGAVQTQSQLREEVPPISRKVKRKPLKVLSSKLKDYVAECGMPASPVSVMKLHPVCLKMKSSDSARNMSPTWW